ncbi:hypothetical protein HOC13_02755 [Candidatus Woesearchaeota archaeon]|jgi:hypothetical protein|nr:hypothetical protein [Candidatus Woesearchaeota archaeon]
MKILIVITLFMLTLSLAFVSAEESFQISPGNKNLELGEPIGSVVSSIGRGEFNLLANGNVSNIFGTVEYIQYLFFPEESGYVIFAEDDDVLADFLYFPNEELIATYELRFSDTFKSKLEQSNLVDFEDKTIYFMGKSYTFVNTIKTSNLVKFNFISGDETLSIEDDDFTTKHNKGRLQVNGNTIGGVKINIEANSDSEIFYLSGITVEMFAEDDYYVSAGEKLSENDELYDSELLFTQMWDISYAGLTEEETHEITIDAKNSGEKYELNLYDASNNAAGLPLMYISDSGELVFGEKEGRFTVLDETKPITKNDYFVLTVEDNSYVMQYKGADRNSKTSPKIKFKNLGSGETLEYSATTVTDTGTVATIKLGGHSFPIQNAFTQLADDYNISIDLNGDGDFDDSGNILIYDYFGAEIIIEESEEEIDFTLHTPFYDFKEVKPIDLEYSIVINENKEVKLIKEDETILKQSDDTDDHEYGYTSYGTFIDYFDNEGGIEELTLTYPSNQRFVQVSILGYESEEPVEDDGGSGGSGSGGGSGNDDLSGFVFPIYSPNELSINLYSINQFAVADNTYENGWQFRFLITFPENESQISLWVDDWENDKGDTLNTAENSKIVYGENDYLVGSKQDYSESDSFIVGDEFPSYPGIQAYFDLFIKIPEDFAGGIFSTTYGIKSLPEE